MKPNDVLIKHKKAINKLPDFVKKTYKDKLDQSVNGFVYKGQNENNPEFYLNLKTEIERLLKWDCKVFSFQIANQDVFILVKGDSYDK